MVALRVTGEMQRLALREPNHCDDDKNGTDCTTAMMPLHLSLLVSDSAQSCAGNNGVIVESNGMVTDSSPQGRFSDYEGCCHLLLSRFSSSSGRVDALDCPLCLLAYNGC